jgi:hypothetical protein
MLYMASWYTLYTTTWYTSWYTLYNLPTSPHKCYIYMYIYMTSWCNLYDLITSPYKEYKYIALHRNVLYVFISLFIYFAIFLLPVLRHCITYGLPHLATFSLFVWCSVLLFLFQMLNRARTVILLVVFSSISMQKQQWSPATRSWYDLFYVCMSKSLHFASIS